VVTCAAVCTATRPIAAQTLGMPTSGRLADWSDAAVGSEEEMYLRLLQAAGIAQAAPWSVRPLAAAEIARLVPADARHPWAARLRPDSARARRRTHVRLLAPGAQVVYNSGFPLSINDGLLWAGRGLSTAVRGGVAARVGGRWASVALRLEPQVAWMQNQRVSIAPNGLTGPARFADALEPLFIDAPQRFGDRAFGRASLGQSTLQVEAVGLAGGLSTANQWFGPTLADPLILGTNAPGFLHAFFGTARPLRLGIGTVHARIQAGRLGQSRYSTVPADSARRLATAVAAVVTVRGVPGLELGGSRFFHGPYPANNAFGPQVRRLTQTFFVVGGDAPDRVQQNQLASVWGRWAFAGGEVWGEYMRNDAASDARDYWQEPDHNSGFALGGRRVWGGPARLSAVRFETLNTRITAINRLRQQTRPYQHGTTRQGHTERGEVLGSASGQGGLATTLGYDRYDGGGRWTAEAARRVVQSSLGEDAPTDRWDVLNYVRVERLRFGRQYDLVVGVAGVAELNRNFGRDAYQLRLDAGLRFGRVPDAR
jgi:hypothetical protein